MNADWLCHLVTSFLLVEMSLIPMSFWLTWQEDLGLPRQAGRVNQKVLEMSLGEVKVLGLLQDPTQARQTDFLTSERNQAINLVGLHVFT